MSRTSKAPAWRNRIVREGIEDPNSLTAHPLNFRQHGAQQQKALDGAIERIGWITRVVVNQRSGRIIDGHLRVAMAIRKGEQVPVTWVDLDDDEEKLALASIDPISAMATQDDALLGQLLEGLTAGNDNLEAFLAAQRDAMAPPPIKTGNTDPDDAPPVPVKVRVRHGDVWHLGQHRLVIGDSCDRSVVAAAMDGHKADAVWTDPPYNVAYEGSDGKTIQNDSMSDRDFRAMLVAMFTAAIQVTKPGAAIYIAHAHTESDNFFGAAKEAGWSIRQGLVWVKNALVMGRQDYQWQHEAIAYGWKPGASHRWFGERNKATVIDDRVDPTKMGKAELIKLVQAFQASHAASVIDCAKPSRNDVHPTMKPVGLIRDTLGNSVRAGEHVLDFCGGSGSTLIAAEQMGLVAHLVELDPRYGDAIVSRYQEFTGQKATRASDGKLFDSITPRLPHVPVL